MNHYEINTDHCTWVHTQVFDSVHLKDFLLLLLACTVRIKSHSNILIHKICT
jgi:hypothetical protein